MANQVYPSDLSDQAWAIVQPLLPVHQGRGRRWTCARFSTPSGTWRGRAVSGGRCPKSIEVE